MAKRTKLTEEFPLDAFRRHYGDLAVIPFVVDDGKVDVVTFAYDIPESRVAVIALIIEPEDTLADDA